MKAYFYIKDLFNQASANDGSTWLAKVVNYEVNSVDQLTVEYWSETSNNYESPLIDWEYSDCSDNGSEIDVCEIGGASDSFNPFFSNLNAKYDSVVNGQNRGAFLESNSLNLYGLEGSGLGFDKISVPVNDIPSGGSSGASSFGAFFMELDQTVDFSLVITVIKKDGGGVTVSNVAHRYFWRVDTCSFSYETQELLTASPIVDQTPFAFLTGGLSGWIDFGCGSQGGDLGDDPIVTQSIGIIARTPQQPQQTVGSENECCYLSPALASSTDSDEFKNDIKGFIFKRNFSSETITMTLQKNGGVMNGGSDIPLVNNDFGSFNDFGSYAGYPNYKGYDIEWQKVLLLEGEGTYQLRIDSVFITGSQTDYSVVYKLNEFTQDRANQTFFMKGNFNGYIEHLDFDFTGLNWKDGVRVRGFFGNRQAEYEKESIIYTNRESKTKRNELLNTYVCQTMRVPSCVTNEIIEFFNFSDRLFMTDYNENNHVKTYNQKEVTFDSIESIEYSSLTTFAPLTLKYRDYVQNYRLLNC